VRHPPDVQYSSEAGRFTRRSVAGFVVLVLGTLLLAGAVQMAGSPVVRVDQAVAGDLNAVVAPRPWLVTTLEVLTAAGASVTAWVVLATLTLALLARGRRHLALYVAITGLGGAMLSPLIKQLVGRLRPMVDVPVATALGPSFPSGHTLSVTLWVGVVLLVLLPAVPAQRRRLVIAAGVALVVVVGLTRIALGVHFVSDVLGGWLVGTGWLLVTATAFRSWRRHEGQPVGSVTDGLDPEAAPDLEPAPGPQRLPAHPLVTAAQLLVAAVLLLGALFGIGWLVVHLEAGSGVEAADIAAVEWLAQRRTALLDALSGPVAELGNTGVVVAGGAVAALLALAVTRRVAPALVLAVALVGEVAVFVTATALIDRPRPPVPHLDAELPPTSSFPSGHVAAAVCLYIGVAALVLRATRAWWRWAVLGAAVLVVVAVALARLYRGAHHPTDVLASLAFAVPWLLVTLRLLDGNDRDRAGPHPPARRPLGVGPPR
jgi:undecaprenyl-diphosphatase